MEDRGRIIVEVNDGVFSDFFENVLYFWESVFRVFLKFQEKSQKYHKSYFIRKSKQNTSFKSFSPTFKFKSQYPQLLIFFRNLSNSSSFTSISLSLVFSFFLISRSSVPRVTARVLPDSSRTSSESKSTSPSNTSSSFIKLSWSSSTFFFFFFTGALF